MDDRHLLPPCPVCGEELDAQIDYGRSMIDAIVQAMGVVMRHVEAKHPDQMDAFVGAVIIEHPQRGLGPNMN